MFSPYLFNFQFNKDWIKPFFFNFEDVNFVICFFCLTVLHSERPKLYGVLAVLSAIGLRTEKNFMKYGVAPVTTIYGCSKHC